MTYLIVCVNCLFQHVIVPFGHFIDYNDTAIFSYGQFIFIFFYLKVWPKGKDGTLN